jgi:hypothetical protein
MCNCIEESVKKTTEHLKSIINNKREEIYEFIYSDYEHHSFLFGEKTDDIIAMPFKFTYIRLKTNGFPENKRTTLKVNILPTYCPFCGKKREETIIS